MLRTTKFVLMAAVLLCSGVQAGYAADAYKRIEAVNPALAERLQGGSGLTLLDENDKALDYILKSREVQQQLIDGALSVSDVIAKVGTAEDTAAKNSLERMNSRGARADLQRQAASDLDRATSSDTETTPPIQIPTTDVYEHTDITTPSTPTTTPMAQLIDLNAVPEGDYSDKDAKGWPTFMKVPADCPAADSNKDYYHEFRYSRNDARNGVDFGPHPGGTGIYAHKYISPVMNAGGTMQFNITDKEVYAVPFYTDMPQGGQSMMQFSTEDSIGFDVGIDMVVMRCPGVFPDNEPDYQGLMGFTAVVDADNNTERLGRGTGSEGGHLIRLKPNTRYFMNIKVRNGWNCTQQAAEAELTPATHPHRNGAPICVTLLSGSGNAFDAPYTGQCLREGPFPIGYDNWVCGDQYGLQGMKRRYRCFDTLKRVPESRYEAVGTTQWGPASWVMGANKPVYAGMECAAAGQNGQGAIQDWDKMPVHRVCAQHSEGFTKEAYVCRQPVVGQPLRTMLDKRECKWDADRGYYHWMLTGSSQAEVYCNQNTAKQVWKDREGTILEDYRPGAGYWYYLGETR